MKGQSLLRHSCTFTQVECKGAPALYLLIQNGAAGVFVTSAATCWDLRMFVHSLQTWVRKTMTLHCGVHLGTDLPILDPINGCARRSASCMISLLTSATSHSANSGDTVNYIPMGLFCPVTANQSEHNSSHPVPS